MLKSTVHVRTPSQQNLRAFESALVFTSRQSDNWKYSIKQFNPIALRMAKIAYPFGLSGYNGVNCCYVVVVLRPRKTSKVMSGRSVPNHTFLGQA